MIERTLLYRLFTAHPPLRTTFRPPPLIQVQQRHTSLKYSTSVTQPAFWASLVPKPLRQRSQRTKKPKSKEWNPATFYIVIFMFIGSMSIQMIALRNEFAAFSRRADAKIDLLKEVIGRVQNGEEVDVEGLLGTGDPEKEKEWEEVMKEIEKEEEVWSKEQNKKPRRKSASEEKSAEPVSENDVGKPKTKSNAPRGFY